MTPSAQSPQPANGAIPFFLSREALRAQRALLAKAYAQELHFRRRVRERYGLTLSAERYRAWIVRVEEVLPGTKFLCQGSVPGRTLWRIRRGGVTFRVVYDETTRRLVTCLPARGRELAKKRLRRVPAEQVFGEAEERAGESERKAA